jgi:hypothetical protein
MLGNEMCDLLSTITKLHKHNTKPLTKWKITQALVRTTARRLRVWRRIQKLCGVESGLVMCCLDVLADDCPYVQDDV